VLQRYVAVLRRERQPFRFLLSRALMYSGLSKAIVIQKRGFKLRFYPTNASAQQWVDPYHRHDKHHGYAEETFFRRYLRPGDVVVDVGANFGLTALSAFSAVGSTGHVYAFEPHPRIFRYLVGNIALNRASDVITPYNIALGDHAGTVFLTDSRADDQNTVSREATHILVAQSTLDDVVEPLHRIALLKIDVEGYEKFVLEGATATLAHVECVFFESNAVSYAAHGYVLADVVNLLVAQGFQVRRLDLHGSTTAVEIDETSSENENLVAVRDVDRLDRRLNGRP
jgi:FkbM family methyltransferase